MNLNIPGGFLALIIARVPPGAHYQDHSFLIKAMIEIAMNLVSAQRLAAYSNYEHEMVAEESRGLPPAKVQAL